MSKPRWHSDHDLEYLVFCAELIVEKVVDDGIWVRLKEIPEERLEEDGVDTYNYDYDPIEKQAKFGYDCEVIDDISWEHIQRVAIGYWLMGGDTKDEIDDNEFTQYVTFKHYNLDEWSYTEEEIEQAKKEAQKLMKELNWGESDEI